MYTSNPGDAPARPNRLLAVIGRIAIFVFSTVACLLLAAVGLETWARYRWPDLGSPAVTLRYFPYIENVYMDHTEDTSQCVLEPECFGYARGEHMYQYRSARPVRYAGQRFEGVFQY